MIAIIALIVLGPSRLPEAARSLGRGIREMRDSFQSAAGDDDDDGSKRRPSVDPFDEPDGGAYFDGIEDGYDERRRERAGTGARRSVGASERSS